MWLQLLGVPTPSTCRWLRESLEGLPPDVICGLITTAYIGRGELRGWDFDQRKRAIPRMFPEPDLAVRQMVGKTPLARYLREGLSKVAHADVNADAEMGRIVALA